MIKLDFLILSVGRVATQAIWRYADSHPEVFLPSFYDTDDLIKDDKYKELENFYMQAGEHQKKGIIIHSPKSLKAVEELEFNKLVHMVRNPFDLIKSLYNQTIHRSYVFTDRVKHPGSFERYVEDNLNELRLYEIGKPFYAKASEKRCIEFSLMGTGKVDSTMESLFDFLSVSQTQSKELFHINQQDDTSVFMRGVISPNFVHNNGKLRIYMAYEGDDIFNNGFYLKVFSIEDPEKTFGALGYPHPSSFQSKRVNVYLAKEELASVTPKEKALLDKHLMGLLETAFINWCKTVDRIDKIVKPQRIQELSKEQMDFLKKLLKSDMDKLFKEFSDLKVFWSVNDYGQSDAAEGLLDFNEKSTDEILTEIESQYYKKTEDSLSFLNALEKKNIRSAEIFEAVGLLYLELGKTEKAMENFKKGSSISPSSPSFNVHIARIFQMEENYQKTLEYLLKADGVSGGKTQGIKKVIGDLYLENDNIDLAEEFYLEELDQFGFDPIIMENLKNIYYTKGNEAKFVKVMELWDSNE